MSNRGRQRENPLDTWVPKTRLGRMVHEGQVLSISEIFEENYRIKEVEIIDILVPDLKDEVIDINLVQKQTDAGERSRFRAIVAVGNSDGLIGMDFSRGNVQVSNHQVGWHYRWWFFFGSCWCPHPDIGLLNLFVCPRRALHAEGHGVDTGHVIGMGRIFLIAGFIIAKLPRP